MPRTVCLAAVDKAILDLLPYPLANLPADMALDLAAALASFDADAMRLQPEAVAAVFDAALRRSNADPWIVPSTQVRLDTGFDGTCLLLPPLKYAVSNICM